MPTEKRNIGGSRGEVTARKCLLLGNAALVGLQAVAFLNTGLGICSLMQRPVGSSATSQRRPKKTFGRSLELAGVSRNPRRRRLVHHFGGSGFSRFGSLSSPPTPVIRDLKARADRS